MGSGYLCRLIQTKHRSGLVSFPVPDQPNAGEPGFAAVGSGRRKSRQPLVQAGRRLNRSCNMGIIDIAILFDTQGILSAFADRSHDFDEPTLIEGNDIFLITESNSALGGLGTGHLTIRNCPNALLRWRPLSLFGRGGHSAGVYHIFRVSESSTVEEFSAVLSRRSLICPIQTTLTDEPKLPTSEALEFYLESPVPNGGTHGYKIRFYITEQDRSSGEPKIAGYFEWRATLTFAGIK